MFNLLLFCQITPGIKIIKMLLTIKANSPHARVSNERKDDFALCFTPNRIKPYSSPKMVSMHSMSPKIDPRKVNEEHHKVHESMGKKKEFIKIFSPKFEKSIASKQKINSFLEMKMGYFAKTPQGTIDRAIDIDYPNKRILNETNVKGLGLSLNAPNTKKRQMQNQDIPSNQFFKKVQRKREGNRNRNRNGDEDQNKNTNVQRVRQGHFFQNFNNNESMSYQLSRPVNDQNNLDSTLFKNFVRNQYREDSTKYQMNPEEGVKKQKVKLFIESPLKSMKSSPNISRAISIESIQILDSNNTSNLKSSFLDESFHGLRQGEGQGDEEYNERVLSNLKEQTANLLEVRQKIKSQNNDEHQQMIERLMESRRMCNERRKEIDFLNKRLKQTEGLGRISKWELGVNY